MPHLIIIIIFQVDSSFLEAIPKELQEELKQDLARRKQMREVAVVAALPGVRSVRGALGKSGSGRGRGESLKFIVCT